MFRYVQKNIPHFEYAQVDKKYYTALISSAQIKNIKFLASYNMMKKKIYMMPFLLVTWSDK